MLAAVIARLRAARAGGGYERWQRRTDRPLLALAVAFVVVLLLPVLANLTPTQTTAVNVANAIIWAAFVVDYVARLYLAPRRWAFVRAHVLDLLIVLLPMLRPLRALRILRLGSVVGVAQRRAQHSLHLRVTTYVVASVVVVLGVAGAAMVDAEREAQGANIRTLADGLWWAAATVTTVGYGDRYPTTATGRLIAVGLMVVGIALLGVVTATIAAWFVDRLRGVQEAEEKTEATLTEVLDELREIRARLDSIERQTAPGKLEG
jgi:voltage-gated potassium channel